jgi:hypothetical protein
MEDSSWFVAVSGSARNAGGRILGKRQSAMGARAVLVESLIVGSAAAAVRTILGIKRDAKRASMHVKGQWSD